MFLKGGGVCSFHMSTMSICKRSAFQRTHAVSCHAGQAMLGHTMYASWLLKLCVPHSVLLGVHTRWCGSVAAEHETHMVAVWTILFHKGVSECLSTGFVAPTRLTHHDEDALLAVVWLAFNCVASER